MGADLKAELHVPDLWFDFYARLLPGTAFVGGIRCLILGIVDVPAWAEIFVILAIGYLAGLFTNPLGSRCAGRIERVAELSCSVKEALFIRRVQKELGPESRASMILFKMHGEVTFFVQLGLLSLVYWLVEIFVEQAVTPLKLYPLAFAAVCAVIAYEVALRRLQRAMKDGELYSIRPNNQEGNLKGAATKKLSS